MSRSIHLAQGGSALPFIRSHACRRLLRRTTLRTLCVTAAMAALASILIAPAHALAEQRGYELVTPPDDRLYHVNVPGQFSSPVPTATDAQRTTPDGRHVIFELGNGGLLPGMAPDGEVPDYFLSSRAQSGWDWAVPLGDRSGVGCGFASGQYAFDDVSDDAGTMLVRFVCEPDRTLFGGLDPDTGEPFDQTTGTGTLYRVDVATDSATMVTRKFDAGGQVPRTDMRRDDFLGGSDDLSTVYVATGAGLFPGMPDESDTTQYVYREDDGVLNLVTRNATGDPFPVRPNTMIWNTLNRPGTVSEGGRTFTLSVQGSSNPIQNASMVEGDTNTVADVYQVRDGEALWVSSPDAVPPATRPTPAQTPANRLFEASSTDGARVYFSTTERLTADDTDTVKDVYVYERAKPADSRISRVSAKDAACAACDDNLSSTTGQSHSQAKFVAASRDGSRMFLVTGDVLAPADADGQQSLYVHELGGATTYVAPVGAGVTTATNGADAGTGVDGSLTRFTSTAPYSQRPIKLSTDGRVAFLSLVTNISLPAGRGGMDEDSARDLFVWREGEGLRRVSQGPGADDNTSTVAGLGCDLEKGVGQADRARCRGMSDDGAVVFLETTDSLAAGDTDGGLFDVYAMHTADGSIEMISPPGGAPEQAVVADDRYVDNSASGDDVFFLTPLTLDPSRDTDMGLVDIYAARRGDVFGPLQPPAPPCTGDACRPPARAAPDRAPEGSSTPGASGNAAPAPRARLSIAPPGRRARAAAARRGLLVLTLRTNVPGSITARASARLGSGRDASRGRTVARDRVRAAQAGSATARLRLARAARRRLETRGRLRLSVEARMPGARTERLAVLLRLPENAR
jgi:hypothetical protein